MPERVVNVFHWQWIIASAYEGKWLMEKERAGDLRQLSSRAGHGQVASLLVCGWERTCTPPSSPVNATSAFKCHKSQLWFTNLPLNQSQWHLSLMSSRQFVHFACLSSGRGSARIHRLPRPILCAPAWGATEVDTERQKANQTVSTITFQSINFYFSFTSSFRHDK